VTTSFHQIAKRPLAIRRASQITALALIVTVATQLLYVASGALGVTPDRAIVWGLEVLAFLTVAIFGLALVPARPVAGAGVAMGGVLNVIQAGMGLVMFGPLGDAGEAMAPAFQAVLAGAFLLYFAGKAAFALAGLQLGVELWQSASGGVRFLGLAAVITGGIGLVLNLVMTFGGMQVSLGGMGLLYPAGGAGTAATLFLALILTASIDRADAPTSA